MTSPFNANGPNSPEPSEDLRDARLAQALQHMPDAHMQPSAQTRQAVLQEALRAAAPPPAAVSRWWHAWLDPSDQRMPWSAALASLAVASFITVLWYGQEVPDATPERGPVVQREEASKDTSQDTAGIASGSSARMDADKAVARSAAPGKERMKEGAASPAREMAQKAAPAVAPVAEPAAAAAAEAPASVAANTAFSAAESRADSARAGPPPPPSPAAAAAPAPVAAGGLAKSQAYASPPQRSFSNTPALADAQAGASAATSGGTSAESKASPALTISVDGVKRSVRPEQAQNLLNLLRGLTYGPAPVLPKREEPGADLVVDIAGEERWAIAPDYVLHQTSTMRAQSDITPAQYVTLRRLAMEIKVQP